MTAERYRALTNGAMFVLGLTGAAWQFFVQDSQNPYVYALIIALLRLAPGVTDRVIEKLGEAR